MNGWYWIGGSVFMLCKLNPFNIAIASPYWGLRLRYSVALQDHSRLAFPSSRKLQGSVRVIYRQIETLCLPMIIDGSDRPCFVNLFAACLGVLGLLQWPTAYTSRASVCYPTLYLRSQMDLLLEAWAYQSGYLNLPSSAFLTTLFMLASSRQLSNVTIFHGDYKSHDDSNVKKTNFRTPVYEISTQETWTLQTIWLVFTGRGWSWFWPRVSIDQFCVGFDSMGSCCDAKSTYPLEDNVAVWLLIDLINHKMRYGLGGPWKVTWARQWRYSPCIANRSRLKPWINRYPMTSFRS